MTSCNYLCRTNEVHQQESVASKGKESPRFGQQRRNSEHSLPQKASRVEGKLQEASAPRPPRGLDGHGRAIVDGNGLEVLVLVPVLLHDEQQLLRPAQREDRQQALAALRSKGLVAPSQAGYNTHIAQLCQVS